MPTSPYMTDQGAPFQQRGSLTNWQKFTYATSAINSAANLVSTVYKIDFRHDYDAAKSKATQDITDRNTNMSDPRARATDTRDKLNSISTDTSLSDGARQAYMDVYGRADVIDHAQAEKLNRNTNLQTVANIAPLLDNGSYSVEDMKHVTNELAAAYNLTPEETQVALTQGSLHNASQEVAAAAEAGGWKAVQAQKQINELNLKKYNLDTITATTMTPSGRILASSKHAYDASVSGVEKAIVKDASDYITGTAAAVKADPTSIPNMDMPKWYEKSQALLDSGNSKTVNKANRDLQEATNTYKYVSKYNDPTTVPSTPALNDKGFRKYRESQVVSAFNPSNNTPVETKVAVLNANPKMLTKVSEQAQARANVDPWGAYQDISNYRRTGNNPVVTKLYPKEVVSNLDTTSAVQAIMKNEDGSPVTWTQAQNKVAEARQNPLFPKGDDQAKMYKFVDKLRKSGMPASMQAEAQKAADVAYSATGDSRVYETIFSKFDANLIDGSGDSRVDSSTFDTVKYDTNKLTNHFNNEVKTQLNLPNDTRLLYQGTGDGRVVISTSNELFGETPAAILDKADLNQFENKATIPTEGEKKMAVVRERAISNVSKILNTPNVGMGVTDVLGAAYYTAKDFLDTIDTDRLSDWFWSFGESEEDR